MIILWIIAVIAIVNIIPVIRYTYKRIILRNSIKSACKRYGFEFEAYSQLWFLSGKKGKRTDFSVRSKDMVWKVKLAGAYSKISTFNFKQDGTGVSVTDHVMLFSNLGGVIRLDLDIKYYDLSDINFRFRERPDDCFRDEIHVLLMHPVPCDSNMVNSSKTECFHVFTRSGFIDTLEYEKNKSDSMKLGIDLR